jgi:hypothetical protein
MPSPSAGSGRSEQRSAAFGPDQHELLAQQLRRSLISRRNMLKGGVGAAGAAFLLGNGFGSRAFADQLTSTGTVAGGFVINGRHLAFGADPRHQMAVAGQLFNLNTYNAVPSGIAVSVQYGTDPSYGAVAPVELRELVTHVPVWNGVPSGPVTASTTDLLGASQFYAHALLVRLLGGAADRLHTRRHLHHRAGPDAGPPAVHLHRLRRPGHHRQARHRPDPGQRPVAAAGVLVAHHRRLLRHLRPRLLRSRVENGTDRHLSGRRPGPPDHQGPQPGERHADEVQPAGG